MNRFRFMAIFFIISIGLAGSYFIVKNSSALPEVKPAIGNRNSEGNLLTKNPIKWVEQPQEKSGISGSNLNITNQLAAIIFEKMRKTDANGQNPFSKINFNNSEKDILIKKVLADSNLSKIFSISISDKDLNVDKDNSPVAKIRYLDTTGGIISNYLTDPYKNPMKAVKKMLETGDASDIKKLENIYGDIYKDFLKTSVPSEWINLHKRYLVLLKKAELIYAGIADFQDDPIKAEIFIKLTPDIIQEELSIKEEYVQKVKDLSLYL